MMSSNERSERHPNWDLAESLLRRSFPGATGFDLDQIPALRSASVWEPFPMQTRDIAEIRDDLITRCISQLSSTVVLVTIVSYRPAVGPFFLECEQLARFAEDYPDGYNDAFVTGGDITALSLETGSLIAVHHNEAIAYVSGNPPLADTNGQINGGRA